jgi:hypothetical protein
VDSENGPGTKGIEKIDKNILEDVELIHGSSNANLSGEPNLSPLHIKIHAKTQLIHPKSNRRCQDSNEEMPCKLIIRINIKIHKVGNQSPYQLDLSVEGRG